MSRHYLISTALFAILPALSGCGGGQPLSADGGQRLSADVAQILEKADEIELYSLDLDKKAKKAGTGFRDWKVLGQTTLSGDDKKAIVKALQLGIAESDGMVAACFNPRHGIEATYEGKTVELVICFECLSLEGWNDGRPFKALTTGDPAEEFNRMLKAKGVALPKAKE